MSERCKKKLLMIFDTPFPFVLGGGQRRIFEIGKRLAEHGRVDWLCFKAWNGDNRITSDGINYIGTRDIPSLYGESGNRNAKEPILFLLDVVKKLLSLRLYDTVWVAQWPLIHLIPIILVCKVFRVRLVIDWWEVWDFRNWYSYARVLGPIGFAVQQITLLFVRVFRVTVVTDNNVEFKKLKAVLGKDFNLEIIPNGIPVEQIEKGIIEASSGYDIVSLGRLKNHKGVDILIKAVSLLSKSHLPNLRVGIIGDGPERENLSLLIQELGLESNIDLLGSIESFETVYGIVKSSKLCALTTHNGGGGNLTLLEAYGCNLPVVAFRTEGGIDENLIIDRDSGLFVNEVTAEALSEALLEILSNNDLLAQMRVGAARFAKSLTWQTNAVRYKEIIFPERGI